MRTLFFLLLLVNLGTFLYFHYQMEARTGADIEPIPAGTPTVILVSEYQGGTEEGAGNLTFARGDDAATGRVEVRSGASAGQPVSDAGGSPDPVDVRKRCLVLGPFQDRVEARNLRSNLERLGFDVQSKVESTVTAADRYRIWIPPLDSAAQARQTMARLRENGIRDISLGRGDDANSVLLGYYKSPVLAEQRRKRIARYGFAPVVEPMRKAVDSYTLYYELLQDEPSFLPESLAKYRPNSNVVDCKVVK